MEQVILISSVMGNANKKGSFVKNVNHFICAMTF